jgi:hypothetical protein
MIWLLFLWPFIPLALGIPFLLPKMKEELCTWLAGHSWGSRLLHLVPLCRLFF